MKALEFLQFDDAATKVKSLKSSPTNDELLQLYALYKQGTAGDNTTAAPGMFDLKGKAKWNAWNEKKGKSQDEAKKEYVELAENLIAKYGLAEDNINRNWKSLPGGKELGRDNSMLSARGKKQAEECANRFSKLQIDHIFASPFDRTIETACSIAKPHGIDVKPEPGLCEALYLCESPPSFWDAEKLAEKFQTIDLDYVPVYSKHTMPKEGYGDDACVPRLKQTLNRLTEKYEGNLVLIGHGASIGSIHEVLNDDFKYVGQATVSQWSQTGPGQFKHNYSSDASHLSDKSNLRPWNVSTSSSVHSSPSHSTFQLSPVSESDSPPKHETS
ncbi:hypothetical protein WR25_19000 [Diploscapter pachys]|uniref:ACB domain-containing protein n=1 Tax=Diploscapter pachys TaxID=2018661 RepID=A0A2A2KG43_9BILA|nr:hypothetical protein WR25_19000 [Diploscapter pachys]